MEVTHSDTHARVHTHAVNERDVSGFEIETRAGSIVSVHTIDKRAGGKMMKRTHSVSLVSLTVTLAIFSPTVGRIFGSLAAAASTADSDEEEGDSSPGCVTLSLGRDTSSLTCSNNVVFPACPHQAHSYTDTQTHIYRQIFHSIFSLRTHTYRLRLVVFCVCSACIH